MSRIIARIIKLTAKTNWGPRIARIAVDMKLIKPYEARMLMYDLLLEQLKIGQQQRDLM